MSSNEWNDNERKPLIEKANASPSDSHADVSALYSSLALHNLDKSRYNARRNPSRWESAHSSWTGWLTVLFWCWINPLLRSGFKHTLTDDDLDDLPAQDKSRVLMHKLLIYDWSTTSTWRIVFKAFGRRTLPLAVLLLPYILNRLLQPLLIRGLVMQVDQSESTPVDWQSLIVLIGSLGTCTLVNAVLHQQFFFRSALLGYHIRHALSSIIYRHVLSVQLSSVQQTTSAQILNLLTYDTSTFEDLCVDGHFIWAGPLEALLTFAVLYWINGPLPTAVAFLLSLLLVPLQLFFAGQFMQHRFRTMIAADRRLKAFSEILHGCQLMKIYNWEKPMETRVAQTRREELKTIKRSNHLRAFNLGLFFSAPCILGCATFGCIWLQGRCLNAADIFLTLTYYIQLRLLLFRFMPFAAQAISSVRVASKRIDAFMQLKAVPPHRRQHRATAPGAILLHEAAFAWGDGDRPLLSSLSLNIEPGQLVGIFGSVGAGKSSFLAALLNEMTRVGGHMDVAGAISYAAQSSWIFAGTIRANILLGKPWDPERYQRVIRACCLDNDLRALGDAADLTVVGEKGVNLSGGQRARVSLARTLYTDADIYFFDDSLAAVDAEVAKRVFDACIGPRGFLKDKTRLFVTHQRHFLTETDTSILLVDGRCEAFGPFQEISTDPHKHMLVEHGEQTNVEDLDLEKEIADSKSILVEEVIVDGHINWSVWRRLFTASALGCVGLLLLIFLLIAGEVLYNVANVWLTHWTDASCSTQQTVPSLAYVFLSLNLVTVLVAHLRADYWFYVMWRGGGDLHDRMLHGVLYSSMRFFESHSHGRILNRASRDQQTIDEILPMIFFDAAQTLMTVISSVLVITLINPSVIIVVVVLFAVTGFLYHYCQRTNRQLRRLESVTRSPIYAFFSSSLDGLATIRAFKVQDDFLDTFLQLMDTNARAYSSMLACNCWLAFQLDLLTAVFQLVTAVIAVDSRGDHTPSALALTLTYSFTLSQRLARGMQQLAVSEIHMISAERIDEYARIPPEEDDGGEQELVPVEPSWPSRGAIEFCQYTMRYRPDLQPVLNEIDLRVEATEKIGIIGRTGAGKSSLFQAIFRLVDRSTVEGEIRIDDVDISRVRLSQLRSHLSVIPQTPILFSGTLRYNLDPFDIYTDDECLAALHAVQLGPPISLHTAVAEFGNNFSVGECQLICVARALLKSSKILLIDEATANVDHETDALIQRVIADKFTDRTILTIAHRLHTVAGSDRIVVMDRGRVVHLSRADQILPPL